MNLLLFDVLSPYSEGAFFISDLGWLDVQELVTMLNMAKGFENFILPGEYC